MSALSASERARWENLLAGAFSMHLTSRDWRPRLADLTDSSQIAGVMVVSPQQEVLFSSLTSDPTSCPLLLPCTTGTKYSAACHSMWLSSPQVHVKCSAITSWSSPQTITVPLRSQSTGIWHPLLSWSDCAMVSAALDWSPRCCRSVRLWCCSTSQPGVHLNPAHLGLCWSAAGRLRSVLPIFDQFCSRFWSWRAPNSWFYS